MNFINLGARNKGTFWEYMSAYSYLTTKLPDTAFEIPDFFGFGQGMPNQHCHTKEEIEAFCDDLFWKEFEAGMYTVDFFSRMIECYTTPMHELEDLLKDRDFSSCSNEDLSDLCTRGVQCTSITHKPMLQALYLMHLEERFEAELRKILKPEERDNAAQVQQIKALLLTMPELSIANREEAAIMSIERSYRKSFGEEVTDKKVQIFFSAPDVAAAISALVRDFGWFRMEYMHEPFSKEDYEKEIAKRLSSEYIEKSLPTEIAEEIQKQRAAFFVAHPNTDSFKKLVSALHGFAYILDNSKEVAVRDHWLMVPLLNEVAVRLDVTRSDLLFLVLPEITQHLIANTKADRTVIDARKKARAVLLRRGIITWYTGEDAREVASRLIPTGERTTTDHVRELKGIIAYPGIYTGRAVLIRSIQDKEKFSRGDVLVTHDGTAEFNLFLQQAGAIISDEGGMICHAAIVAREMKTPTIVGTRTATQVIKDGDLLEVDASRGVVRILR